MRNITVASRLVDLHTTSSKLQDLVLSEFPGLIFEEQHIIDTSDLDRKVFCFLNLSYLAIKTFLDDFQTKEPYSLRDSQTGQFIYSSH